jgi:hypothetical protein
MCNRDILYAVCNRGFRVLGAHWNNILSGEQGGNEIFRCRQELVDALALWRLLRLERLHNYRTPEALLQK